MGTLQNLINSFSRDDLRREKQFAEAVAWFLRNDPLYREQLKTVWLKKDYPEPGWERDYATDILAETHEGELWAIQAKLVGRNAPITKKDIEGFLRDSDRLEISRRLIVTSAGNITQDAEDAISAASMVQPSSELTRAIPVDFLLRGDLERRRRRRRRDEERDDVAEVDWPNSVESLTLPQRLQGLSPASLLRDRAVFATVGAAAVIGVVLVLSLQPGASGQPQDNPPDTRAVVETASPGATSAPSATPRITTMASATVTTTQTAKPAPSARPDPAPTNPAPTKSVDPVTPTETPFSAKPTTAGAVSSATTMPTAPSISGTKRPGKPADRNACRISREGYCIFAGKPHNSGLKPGTDDIVDRNGKLLFGIDEAAAANSEGEVLEAKGKPAADGDDLIKLSQEGMTNDEKAFHWAMAIMYPIRNALMYDIADLTQAQWDRLTNELRIRRIKETTYTTGPTPKDNYYGRQGIFDLAKRPGGKDIHHDVMKFLEESGLYLLCHVTTDEFNQTLKDTHPEGHDACGDAGITTSVTARAR